MALLRTITGHEDDLVLSADPVFLRYPAASDYEQWAELRGQSRDFLTPWEPTWPHDDLTRSAFRRRLKRYGRDIREDQAYPFFIFRAADARLVGMGYLYVWHNQGIWEQVEEVEFKSGIIDDVWVEPDFRKLGVFSAILKELLAFAECHDIDELILEYAVSNEEAAATWTKLGFKPTGVRAAAFTSVVQDALAKRR